MRAIVDIARGLGKETVAEFVEDEATLELLGTLGVDRAQGYHVGRPRLARPCPRSRPRQIRPARAVGGSSRCSA